MSYPESWLVDPGTPPGGYDFSGGGVNVFDASYNPYSNGSGGNSMSFMSFLGLDTDLGDISVGGGGWEADIGLGGGNITLPDIDLGPIKIGGGTVSIGGGGSDRDKAVAIVNAYETRFRANLDAYKSGSIMLSKHQQNFDMLWSSMIKQLGTLAGDEGRRAIQDRDRGGKFDWWAAYRVGGSDATDSLGGGTGGSVTAGFGVGAGTGIFVVVGLFVLMLFMGRAK